jgi:hypothetical protein
MSAASDRIVQHLKDGWRLYGTPHLRNAQGYLCTVDKRTFKMMVDKKIVVPGGKGAHEYVLPEETP